MAPLPAARLKLMQPFQLCLNSTFFISQKLPRKKQLPVIVLIHGGAWFAGAAGPSLHGADYLMDTEDVVFVSVSYRLGPLGFMSTGDENMSGNFGLKDQAMALKWVSENIGDFGGEMTNRKSFKELKSFKFGPCKDQKASK